MELKLLCCPQAVAELREGPAAHSLQEAPARGSKGPPWQARSRVMLSELK